jgi:hypothetical protein
VLGVAGTSSVLPEALHGSLEEDRARLGSAFEEDRVLVRSRDDDRTMDSDLFLGRSLDVPRCCELGSRTRLVGSLDVALRSLDAARREARAARPDLEVISTSFSSFSSSACRFGIMGAIVCAAAALAFEYALRLPVGVPTSMVILGGLPVLEFDMDLTGAPEALAASRSFHAGSRGAAVTAADAACADSKEEESDDSVAAVDVCDDGLDACFVTPDVWYAVAPLLMLVNPSSTDMVVLTIVQ